MGELKSDFEMQKFFKTVEVKGVSDILNYWLRKTKI